MDDEIIKYLNENYECFDRFTFDKIFKYLLSKDFSQEEAKDMILINCSLSSIIFQERIHNNFYKSIQENELISEDLRKFKNEIFKKYFYKERLH